MVRQNFGKKSLRTQSLSERKGSEQGNEFRKRIEEHFMGEFVTEMADHPGAC